MAYVLKIIEWIRAMPRKYELPVFLADVTSRSAYIDWLSKKAATHVKRDKERGNTTATTQKYKVAIHNAVISSNGSDAYTGEDLDWSLLGKYNNEESKKGGRTYKARFNMLPSVDHVSDGIGDPDFKICAWQTNDAKNDKSLVEFLEICQKVIAHNS